jgi:hypothetical protein
MNPKEFPYIWLQPGAYNSDIVEFAEKKASPSCMKAPAPWPPFKGDKKIFISDNLVSKMIISKAVFGSAALKKHQKRAFFTNTSFFIFYGIIFAVIYFAVFL